MKKKQEIMVIVDWNDNTTFSVEELSEICNVSSDWIQNLLEYGILEPHLGSSLATWRFDNRQLQRARTAVRLYHDLEVNEPGIALVLDLLEELEEMRARAEVLEKYLK